MKVRELLALLASYPPEALVFAGEHATEPVDFTGIDYTGDEPKAMIFTSSDDAIDDLFDRSDWPPHKGSNADPRD